MGGPPGSGSAEPHGHQGPSCGSRRHPRKFPFHLSISSAVCMTSQNVLLSLDLICGMETLTDTTGTSLVVQWLRIRLPMQGTRVQSLVGELRSHMTQGN